VAAGAFADTVVDLAHRNIEQEPNFTDRVAARLGDRLNGFSLDGFQWTAKTFTDRGRGSQESRVGADFAGVLDWRAGGSDVQKGFLAQAKLSKAGARFTKAQANDLLAQCNRMLEISPASFVFLYSERTVKVVPAITVAGSDGREPWTINSWTPARFFQAHFECFIGDRLLRGPGEDLVRAIDRQIQVRAALVIEVRDVPDAS
jgi:hypothetical protein